MRVFFRSRCQLNRALRLDCTSYRAVWRTLSGRCDLEGVVVNLVDGVPSLRTSGQAAAALPRSATELRRLMQYCPRGQSLPKGSVVRHSKIDHRMAEMGQTLPSRDFCGTAALPLKPDIARRGWDGRRVPCADFQQPFSNALTRCRLQSELPAGRAEVLLI
jgi:hypothetical protein